MKIKKEKPVQVNVRMPPGLWRDAHRLAGQRSQREARAASASQILRDALAEKIARELTKGE